MSPQVSEPADRAAPAAAPAPSLSRWRRRLRAGLVVGALPFLLGACQVPNFWGYRGSTTQGHDEFKLYVGTFIAAIVVGAIVFGLILWAVLRYRRKSDEMPRQFQYHTGVEVLYTVIPVILVIGVFVFTVITENRVDAIATHPTDTVQVTAFQWGWDFKYQNRDVEVLGHTTEDPVLVLPVGQTVQIVLKSNDVIHGFYVPAFNFSRYAQPGVTNQFDLTVSKGGDYKAQCTQLCGLYHSEMWFHVVALPPARYQAWLTASHGKIFIGNQAKLAGLDPSEVPPMPKSQASALPAHPADPAKEAASL